MVGFLVTVLFMAVLFLIMTCSGTLLSLCIGGERNQRRSKRENTHGGANKSSQTSSEQFEEKAKAIAVLKEHARARYLQLHPDFVVPDSSYEAKEVSSGLTRRSGKGQS